MATTAVEYKIEAASVSKELAKAVADARTTLITAEKALVDAYLTSPRFQAMSDLAGYGSSAYGKSHVTPVVVGNQIVCKIMVDVPAPKKAPQLYADPKTVNLLLSGKILTDAEKRVLVKRVGIDLDEVLASKDAT